MKRTSMNRRVKRLLARVNRLLALEIVCSKSASRYFKPKALPTGASAVDTALNLMVTGIIPATASLRRNQNKDDITSTKININEP